MKISRSRRALCYIERMSPSLPYTPPALCAILLSLTLGLACHEPRGKTRDSADTGQDDSSDTSHSADTSETGHTGDTSVPSPYANCVATLSFDWMLDGETDEAIVSTYDAEGQRVRREYDIDGNSTIDDIYTYTWAESHTVRVERDLGAEGLLDEIWELSWKKELKIQEDHDTDANGVADTRTTWTWGDDQREISALVDQGIDGSPDQLWAWTWTTTDSGTLEELAYDTNADSIADEIETFTFDSLDQELLYTHDNDADGVPSYIETSTWNQQGQLATLDVDYSGDGPAEMRYLFTYDELGRMDFWDLDYGLDGIMDGLGEYVWVCE